MMAVNARAAFALTQACLPHLARSDRAHVLNLAPPPSLDPRWWAPHAAYTLSKMGMSFLVLGMAEELRGDGIAVNALWPATVIATEALRMLPDSIETRRCRRPDIVAEAAVAILARDPRTCTGRFLLDEEVLRERGETEFGRWAVDPAAAPLPDLFVGDPDRGPIP
jgi:citronellol/citronellal dehydrogenase